MIARHEILNLKPDRHLESLVVYWILDKVGCYCQLDGQTMTYLNDIKECRICRRPRISVAQDLGDAWKVVEKLSDEFDVRVSVHKGLSSCAILKEVDNDWKYELIEEQIYLTAPEAICKAALLAKLAERVT